MRSKLQKGSGSISDDHIIERIFLIRGQKVMLDKDLADLFGVETKVLKQAVRRNMDIFPSNFMIILNEVEFKNLRSQFETTSWGGSRYLPFAFTEHGVLQLANVLKSPLARKMSVRIIDAFVKMRQMIRTQDLLIKKLEEIELRVDGHEDRIELLLEYLKQLEESQKDQIQSAERKRIGYKIPRTNQQDQEME
jgi:hypothetical protein